MFENKIRELFFENCVWEKSLSFQNKKGKKKHRKDGKMGDWKFLRVKLNILRDLSAKTTILQIRRINHWTKTKRRMLWRDPCDNHWWVNSGNAIFKGLFSFFLPCVPIENRHVVRYFVDTVLDPPLPSEKRHVNFSDSIACTWSASFDLFLFFWYFLVESYTFLPENRIFYCSVSHVSEIETY